MASEQASLITAVEIADMPERTHVHQFNPNAVRLTKSLGEKVGFAGLGFHLVRVEKGRETTQYHFRHVDEEFLYVLAGRGVAEIGEQTFEVGPGDFMGFRANSEAHTLRNPFDEDLVYIMGGTRQPIDICDYPRIRRRMYRTAGRKEYVDFKDLNEVPKQ